jgi:hypothetical protein
VLVFEYLSGNCWYWYLVLVSIVVVLLVWYLVWVFGDVGVIICWPIVGVLKIVVL